MFSTESGAIFAAAPLHTPPANCTPLDETPGFDSILLPAPGAGRPAEERLLLAYPDGVLEIRDIAGKLLRAVTLADCHWIRTSFLAGRTGQVTFSSGMEGGILDVSTGQIVRRIAQSSNAQVLPEGVLQSDAAAQPVYRFTPWNAPSWTLANLTQSLVLDVQASRTNDTSADVTGTARLDGGRKTAELQRQAVHH